MLIEKSRDEASPALSTLGDLKDLAAVGFSSGQMIIEVASGIIGQISGGLARYKKRMEREAGESEGL